MQSVSDKYRAILADERHRKEIRLDIAGVTYSEDEIITLTTTAALFAEGELSVGSAAAREIDAGVFPKGSIPRMAEVRPWVRLVLEDDASEWIPKGIFWIDTRETDAATGVMTIHGFDAMLKSEQIWEPEQDLTFPMTFRAAAKLCAGLMGVELDNEGDIPTRWEVDYPANDYTLRDILRYIAAGSGGNWHMTDGGRLRLVRLNALPEETSLLVNEAGAAITFGGVRILV